MLTTCQVLCSVSLPLRASTLMGEADTRWWENTDMTMGVLREKSGGQGPSIDMPPVKATLKGIIWAQRCSEKKGVEKECGEQTACAKALGSKHAQCVTGTFWRPVWLQWSEQRTCAKTGGPMGSQGPGYTQSCRPLCRHWIGSWVQMDFYPRRDVNLTSL